LRVEDFTYRKGINQNSIIMSSTTLKSSNDVRPLKSTRLRRCNQSIIWLRTTITLTMAMTRLLLMTLFLLTRYKVCFLVKPGITT